LSEPQLISVVIPTLNEGPTIGAVLDEIDRLEGQRGIRLEVVVVDDGSRDNTVAEVAKRGIRMLANPGSKGKGASLRHGFHETIGDPIVMMDGDGSHRAADIPALVGELQRDPSVGLVIGSRIIGGSDEYSRVRALGNILLTGLFGLLFRRYLSDALNGFKAFRREIIEREDPCSRSFGIETELIASALRCGYRIVEVPTHERARQGGRPKSKVVRHGIVLATSILAQYWRELRRRPSRVSSKAAGRAPGEPAMPMWEVLVADPIHDAGLRVLRSDKRVALTYRPGISPPDLAGIIGDARALVVRGRTPVTAELLSAARRLVVVGRAGSGLDNIDVEAAESLGIAVVNAAQGNAVSTAELSLLHMLALARDYCRAAGTVKGGGWDRETFLGTELHGRVLGVIGLGAVGRALAMKAAGLGMTVLGYDPDAPVPPECRSVSLQELLQTSDYVSVHVPLTAATRHLLGRAELSLMKRGARLLNCARGGLVDEDALREALEEGHLAGAALDVFSSEPPADSALVRRDDVLATPHIGAATREAKRRVAVQVARRVLQVLTDRAAPAPRPPEPLS
jgi:phosphoglycerate dehydrogenase-like enzyme